MKKYLRTSLISLFIFCNGNYLWAQVNKVAAIGITVKDMNRAEKFYEDVLGFKKIAELEYSGAAYEKLEGIFGLHSRVVKLQLGDEFIELTELQKGLEIYAQLLKFLLI